MTFLIVLGIILGSAIIIGGLYAVIKAKNYAIGIVACAIGIILILGMMVLNENQKEKQESGKPVVTETTDDVTEMPSETNKPQETNSPDSSATPKITEKPQETGATEKQTEKLTEKPTEKPTEARTSSVITPVPSGDYTEVHYSESTIVKPNNWNGQTIYLTFDDGPSKTTERVLDNLARYNVKCTFFVIGSQVSSYKDSVERALKEGHSLAVHCYEHEYNIIYASKEAYLNDFNKAVDVLHTQLGYNPLVFRFPGGTSNTTSKKYCPGIMTYLSQEMPKRGYTYCDWNICPDDAMEKQSADTLFEKMKKDITATKKDCYVLLHDYGGMENTADAALKLIEWGLENGYAFDRLTPETKMYQHNPGN